MKAFTLIEVLISIMLFFIIASVAIYVIQNVKYLTNLFSEKKEFVLASSISLIEQKHRPNLYEEIIDFNITNDYIIHILKKYKINIEKEKVKNEYNLSIEKIKAFNKNYSNTAIEIK